MITSLFSQLFSILKTKIEKTKFSLGLCGWLQSWNNSLKISYCSHLKCKMEPQGKSFILTLLFSLDFTFQNCTKKSTNFHIQLIGLKVISLRVLLSLCTCIHLLPYFLLCLPSLCCFVEHLN